MDQKSKQKKEKNKSKKNGPDTVYLVPHTHYDAIWVFTKEDYFYINIDLILNKVIELLDTTDDYKFVIEQTFLLEEVERRFPHLFEKIQKYVKEGRIEIASGEYLMADTMLPQEETLIREILCGKSYVKEKFGVDVPVMWQADSFGLNAQLPQIYKKCGYDYLAFRRGCPQNRPTEFLWEGLDGTKILSHWMPFGYRAGLDLEKLDESYKKLKRLAATDQILMPSGSGVTMPQLETSEAVTRYNKKHQTKIIISTPSAFFRALEKKAKDMVVRKGEMYCGRFSEVFPDCASSRIWLKQSLRRYENKLLRYEKMASLLSLLDGDSFNGKNRHELEDLWKKVLFLAFHDVVPGTGMDAGYDEVTNNLFFLKTKLSYLTSGALRNLVEADSDGESQADVAVFNSLSWDVKNWVEVDLTFEKGQVKRIEALKNGGEEIDVEIIRFTRYGDDSLRYARVGFFADVPALGYRTYWVVEKKTKKQDHKNYIRITGNTIETPHLKVRFSPSTGLIDIIKGRKKICSGNELVIEEETGDLYYHRQTLEKPIKTESGEGIKYGVFRSKNFWIDKSLLRRVINFESEYFALRWPYRLTGKLNPLIWRHKSMIVSKKIIVYRDLPRVDFITTIENKHPMIRLRVKFSTGTQIPEYQCETQFGTVTRDTNQYYYNPEWWFEKPTGIFPSIRWIDYSDGKDGLTLMNRGNPENEVRDGDIYLTLLRGVSMLSSEGKSGPVIPVPDAMELKEYTFKYSAYPHRGDWKKAGSYRQGYEFNCNLKAVQLCRENKFMRERSFLKIEPGNILMTALKPSLDMEGIIIRFYEASGVKTEAVLSLFKKPERIAMTNMLEQELEELGMDGNNIKVNLDPFEIMTIKAVF